MSEKKTIRFLSTVGGYAAGDVAGFPPKRADAYIAKGYANHVTREAEPEVFARADRRGNARLAEEKALDDARLAKEAENEKAAQEQRTRKKAKKGKATKKEAAAKSEAKSDDGE